MSADAYVLESRQIGQTRIQLARVGAVDAPIAIVHVHANEQTAWLAALQMVVLHKGVRAHTIVHGDTREMTLDEASVDPNRCFAGHPLGAVLVDAWRLREPSAIIAAHNNRADGELRVDDFRRAGRLGADATAMARGRGDPHAFFLTTTRPAFSALKGENRVLQAPHATDDGSLSVWAAHAGVPYVNVEALHAKAGGGVDANLEENVRRLERAVHLFL